ncbi:putative acetyltransferase [Serratia entomophila]|uniref:GNAT family N-acetyltransferase n=1 Tax=Serratia entomophila TaxID=42906 RepID=A0ABY5CYC0_9GAMM|nr:GNAT family N-acetyltransferase [Serratia entomophila]UIW19930.1 GNAT family N-acetyltransferase [Serratia entomophila]USV02451.1 GNAT family N-acetyltransferase [Serratia entomophila]CAI0756180.1 putative acetyltransferase [Serratia entomophila]CAI0768426.1 putative acetyltransferase [Serratia entomophila]CAI0775849.1 putative acetyltransferase [Serratia entomophila]
MNITVADTLDEPTLDAIRQGLRAHNQPYIDASLRRPLNVYARDAEGRVVAGLTAFTWGNWLSIDWLWVDDSQRGSGLGRQVMQAAERGALARGCRYSRLDTFSFQARPFYEKLGYQLQMTLKDYPVEHERYFMTKTLTE